MVWAQSESDFPGEGRWLDRNQSQCGAKRQKQVGVSITACQGALQPASGVPSSNVQSLNNSPTERVICFCCEAGGCSAHEAAAVWAPYWLRGMKQQAAWTPTVGTGQRSVSRHSKSDI